MHIYGLLDFFEKKEEIKRQYQKMNKKEVKQYKMYIYSLCFETRNVKDLIWEYINNDKESTPDLYSEYYGRKRGNKRNENNNRL